MKDKKLIFPGEITPELKIDTIRQKNWDLRDSKPDNFTLIIVFRGLHCPICAKYLQEFDKKIDEFNKLGTKIIAISTDNELRAKESFDKWNLKNLNMGYNLKPETALAWGLFLSKGIINPSVTVEEPEVFVEPGLFLVDTNSKLYLTNIQSMPFTRPPVSQLLEGIKFAIEKNYPPRGTLKYLK